MTTVQAQEALSKKSSPRKMKDKKKKKARKMDLKTALKVSSSATTQQKRTFWMKTFNVQAQVNPKSKHLPPKVREVG